MFEILEEYESTNIDSALILNQTTNDFYFIALQKCIIRGIIIEKIATIFDQTYYMIENDCIKLQFNYNLNNSYVNGNAGGKQ